jgi:flagellar hook-length control protein FliK
MGTAKITDISSFFNMTAGNVDMPGKAGTDKDLFAQAMSDASGKGAQNMASGTDESIVRQAKPGEAAKHMQKQAANKADKLTDRTANNSRDDSSRINDNKEEAGKKLEKLTGRIKDAVKEELSVDDEQLEQAMSALGLSPMDLLDSDNIKNLMLELSGEQDAMVLLTNEDLLNSIGSVTGFVEGAIEELSEELGITPEQLATIAEADDGVIVQASGTPVNEAADIETNDDEETSPIGPAATGIKEPASAEDDADSAQIRNGTTPTQASLQKKETAQAKDSSAEGSMQNAMQGQDTGTGIVNEAAAAPETAYSSAYIDREDVLRQVTDNIKLNISGDSTSMELQLHPASLGTVNLQIVSNNGVITANLQVQNETVKSVLEAQLVQLLETFEEQGQKVEAIEVSVAGYDLDRSLNQETGSQDGERREGTAQGVGRTARRRINLNELDEEDIEDMTEEEQLAAEMMAMNGGNVDFMA